MDYGEAVREFEEFFSQEMYKTVAGAVQKGDESVTVDFMEMDKFNPDLSRFLKEEPSSAIDAAEEGIEGVDIVDSELKVRFRDMPEEDFVMLKNLRSEHIGRFVPVEGMIKRASQVKPEVVSGIYECVQCGDRYEVEQDDTKLKSPYKCECGSRKFDLEEKIMTDTQVVTLEENPENREGSEQPSSLSVRLEGDMVDPEFQKQVVPGNVAHVNGILRERPLKKDSKKYDIFMDSNHLEPTEQEFEKLELSEEEEERIEELAEDPDIFQKISSSIAPSIYGHEKVKEAIALQLFGGVKKTREDGVKSRGDIHILLIGEPGTGKCVSPDTDVYLEGKRVKIGEFVDEEIEKADVLNRIDDGVYTEINSETLGMGTEGRLESKNTAKAWKRDAPEKMIRIKTNSGREIEVTPSHPLFISANGRIMAEKAENLKEGSFIAASRKLNLETEDKLDVDYRKSEANNAVRIDLPKTLNPGLSRLIGYIAAEGYIQDKENNSSAVFITNNDEEILEDVENQIRELGANTFRREPHKGKDAEEIVCPSSEMVSFLKNLEPGLGRKSREKKAPEKIIFSSKRNTKGFLKAFIDSEGTVSKKEREICVSSTSKELLEQVREALLRFEIQSQLRTKSDSYRLRVSGKDFQEYLEKIGFVTQRKRISAEEIEGKINTNTDVVPGVGEVLRGLREELGMTQFDFSVGRGRYQHYERLDRNPSRSSLQTIVSDLKDRQKSLVKMIGSLSDPDWQLEKDIRKELGISQSEVSRQTTGTQTLISSYERGETSGNNSELLEEACSHLNREIIERISNVNLTIERLEKMARNDIKWDKIESIEYFEPEYEHVYDLEIPDNHNFLTNGIVSHNSQLLKFTGELAPKGRYAVGKSSTGAGLTASVVKEESTGEFSLEAGAVVLANKGMCAIDEIDKMSVEDRSSLHECMEQQAISVSKANIQATLNAETAILAAGNPKLGRFDPYEPIPQQIEIGDTLLSRFDFIFPVKDEPDEEKDRELSSKVLQNHIEPEDTQGDISQEMLRKYVAYAKRNFRPQLTQDAADKIQDFYVGMRSTGSGDAGDSVPITARQLEALVRVAEASARAELQEKVREKDADRAIQILKHCLEQVGVDPETGDYDIDMIESGVSGSQRSRLQTLKKIINDMGGDDSAVETEEVISRAEEQGISPEKTEKIINKLKSEGELFEPKQGSIQRI